ncbi:hypothetical protein KRP22_002916 [Phytophthora ramorum]|uniref:Archaemetzincin-2 n=1 Tax=Phytophthora ramorum TaxID=164328 RepID=UPI0030ADEF33|nr:Archaemetzincin-2 [Phytophthora ramorum]KAH7503512.1 Archaemetzincin-2 [Phytophthora ramorum]
MASCDHDALCLDPSSYAQRAGYTRRTLQQRVAASRPSGRAPAKSNMEEPDASTFPAPLLLPDDDLAWDPKYGTQSLKSWLQEPYRNQITDERKTVYVVPVPSVAAKVKHVKDWCQPKLPSQSKASAPRPDGKDVVEYLSAFYANLPVKLLTKPKLEFTSWDDGRPAMKRSKVSYIGLAIGTQAVRIRARPSSDGIFDGQFNLEDILDAAIELLPSDAYALLLLVDHDLYEEEDNDFCCGRAYGGSRVAVVSSARYNPALDFAQQVEVKHAWPASHCRKYVDACVKNADHAAGPSRKKSKTMKKDLPAPLRTSSSALESAVRAFSSVPAASQSNTALWLSRFCRTASHELGHCFGMDHCVYYACSMQGSAGLSEDARQPPYLCPVDLAKMLHATGANLIERYKALLQFCERFEGQDRLFAAFSAWLRRRIEDASEYSSEKPNDLAA